MKKRLLSLASALAVSLSAFGVTAFADTSFIDLDSAHWAYSYVDYLVEAGTVKGYEDGSFKPDNTVTRAEFSKMMGVGDNYRNSKDYPDVPKDHWAYEYVMTANFGEEIANFQPDTPITRLDTLKLLWNRQGAPKDYKAPAIITNQVSGTNDKAMVSWAYATNLMAGNDGVHLRLSDTLSRAESAVLIYKSENLDTSKTYNFVETVSDDVLKNIFEQSMLFDDSTYSKDRTFTNGEIARAAFRMILCEYDLQVYRGYSNAPEFEHEYSLDIKNMCAKLWGKDNSNAQFADEKAERIYAYSALAYAAAVKQNKSLPSSGVAYSDITDFVNDDMESAIVDLYANGVMFYADNSIKPFDKATGRDIAALLLQINEYSPLGKKASTAGVTEKNVVIGSAKVMTNPEDQPSNTGAYAVIYEGIPNNVYEFPFASAKADGAHTLPHQEYATAINYFTGFARYFDKVAQGVKEISGAEVEFTIYPNLIYDDGAQFAVRVLCTVKSNPNNHTPETLIPDAKTITGAGTVLKPGDSFFTEIRHGYFSILI